LDNVPLAEQVALVQACLAGDASALGRFVERYQRLVFSVCWKLLGQREEAEDITQESLLRALKHLATWDQLRPLEPWLIRIAVNRCRTRLSQRRELPISELGHVVARSESQSTDLAAEIDRAVAGLRPEYRECFVLFYHQELPVEQVAELLEVPTGTVKTWLFRARRQLADVLRQRGVVSETGYELH
jgi:RNA polymerase sigma-70 factor, ECF subfamily